MYSPHVFLKFLLRESFQAVNIVVRENVFFATLYPEDFGQLDNSAAHLCPKPMFSASAGSNVPFKQKHTLTTVTYCRKLSRKHWS